MKKYANGVKVYEIGYGENEIIRIRATSVSDARRTAKRMTGALIKDMKIRFTMGCRYTAANDKDFED